MLCTAGCENMLMDSVKYKAGSGYKEVAAVLYTVFRIINFEVDLLPGNY